MVSRMSSKKWASWIAAAVIFIIVVTHYTIDVSSLTEPARAYLNDNNSQAGLASQEPARCPACTTAICPAPVTCPACPVTTCPPPETKPFLELPEEYTKLTQEDQLCEDFYTEKYIQSIATNPRSLSYNDGSAVTEFLVPTHPSHRKLNKASPVWLLQGVHWDPAAGAFVAASNGHAQVPMLHGMYPLSQLKFDVNATGCLGSSSGARKLIVYPALWEGTYPNIWHRLQEIWQAKNSFDAMRIALDPTTGAAFITAQQAAAAEVVLPADAPGPWGDLWTIVTPTANAHLPPSALAADACYDVVIPTVGYGSPPWSALLSPYYHACPRQTLLTRFTDRVLAHYHIDARPADAVALRPQYPAITVVQRGATRKFRDFEALLAQIHARHPDAPVNVVDLALLSTREQIALAHNTDVWVAHHGAGLTFVLFMARTAAVVEILPPLFVSRGFRWLSRMRGLVHFTGRAMWQEEYEEKYEGKPKPPGWEPTRQDDRDANEWQTKEWVWMPHDDILDLIDAAVLSQRHRMNDPL